MKILKPAGAEIANGLGFFKRFVDQELGGGIGKPDFHAVVFLKSSRKFIDDLAGHDALFLAGIRKDFLQFGGRIVDQLASDDETFYFGGRQLEFYVAEDAFAYGHETAGAGLFVTGALGNAPEAFVGEQNLNTVSGKIL